MQKATIFFISLFLSVTTAFGQPPKYTPKHLVNIYDTLEFKVIKPPKNGFARTYLLISPDVWDTDDNQTTHVRRAGPALVCIEGPYKNGQKNGIFNAYLIDSIDHYKRYKIWEQAYANDKLNGEWKTYNLKGTVVFAQNFKDDSLNGISRQFWIDGKRIMEEREYFGNSRKYLIREFDKSGKLERELMFENGAMNGTSKRYYETGKVKEEIVFLNGEFHGTRKYYYPSGSLWTEMEYKNGKSWKVISNFDNKGNKRNPGTLNNGNGTLILYNEDGSIRETLNYKNGEQQ